MTPQLDWLHPDAAKPRLTDGKEIAFLDVREHGQYGGGHSFFAVNLPYSCLELDAPARLPRQGVSIVLIDDGDGIAETAARRLKALGYSCVSALAGGAPAWAASGFTLFKGVNLPSKAFGELVEQALHTPSMAPEDLHARLREGGDLVVLDGRPPQEFEKMTIPGAISCPNAELGHRLPSIAPDPETTVVVNCAGRTRSIIGAQSLRNMGFPNPIHALRNGTMGWRLAGFELAHGAAPHPLPEATAEARAASRERAAALIARYKIPKVDATTLADWRHDRTRTLYLFDVRTEQEYRSGHLRGTAHAPGGQLVQATDHWIAVRGARVVLCDDTGLRAANTAVWLRAMGHDACVLDLDVTAAEEQESGPGPDLDFTARLPVLEPGALVAAVSCGAVLLDLRRSTAFQRNRIAGARWTTRPRLGRLGLEPGGQVILAAKDSRTAELAAMDLREMGITRISILAGGPDLWRAAGLGLDSTRDALAETACIDYSCFVHGHHDGDLDAARRYLEWETGLLAQMDAQEKSVLNPPV